MVESARIKHFKALKGQRKIICLAAYPAPMMHDLDTHCDLSLVGNSMAMLSYGMNTTQGAASAAFQEAVFGNTFPLEQHLFWQKL